MSEEICSGILVVDDDDDIRDTIVECLQDEGYTLVVGACNGKEALEVLRGRVGVPCVILLDIMMPVMDGRAFRAEQLLDPRLLGIPVVVVTANADLRATEEELKTTGALRKPVSFAQLLAVVEQHCGKPASPA